ncbi:MAG: filamentous hemagglutinin N-terminal domain-containing protein, partial [Pseudomonadota bacterium]|nr:filamentous hemagglutinin N-terminal domain-containing protein [Pseudomonadota bacterium]
MNLFQSTAVRVLSWLKCARPRRGADLLLLALAAVWPGLRAHAQTAPPTPTTLPQGGQVVQGQAALLTAGTPSAPVLNIDQSTQRAVIDWQRFDLGAAASIHFNQPNAQSATLNRVDSIDASRIQGRITAPGQVTLINPAGVYFGRDAVLDVGALTATTLRQTNADFMAGRSSFTRNGANSQNGAVVNEGALRAGLGGYIALLAPEVRNLGLIVAQQGAVVMAAGDAIKLEFDPASKLASITVSPSTVAALVENRSAVQAPGGLIILSAVAVQSLTGRIVNSGRIDASSVVSRGGRILLEGDDIALQGTSRIDASGATGGGTVAVGGEWQGGGTLHQATNVTMDAASAVDASATTQGEGGTVVLWSDVRNPASVTKAAGSITARGGAEGGHGGQVETSGHTVQTDGLRVNAGAPRGQGGLWLIDPADSVITQPVADGYASTLNGGTDVINSVSGNITWNPGVSLNKTAGGNRTLSLRTANNGNILLDGASIGSTSGALNLVLWSRYNDTGGAGTVSIKGGSNITTNSGHLWIGGGDAGSVFNGLAVGDGTAATYTIDKQGVYIGSATINTGAGSVSLNGLSYSTGTNNGTFNYGVLLDTGTSLSTSSGNVAINGQLRGTYVNGAGVWIGSPFGASSAGNVSVSTGSGSLTVTGNGQDQSGSGTGWRHAVMLMSTQAGNVVTLRSGSGAITLNGAGAFGTGSNDYTNDSSGVQFQVNATTGSVQVVSTSGAITISGQNTQQASQNENAVRLAAADAANSIRIGSDGSTPYSGNILVEGDTLLQHDQQPGAGSIAIQTTGSLTIAPKLNSFVALRAGTSAALTFDDDWNFGTTLGSFTLGKAANTAALTLSNALSVAGSISLYGGDIALQSTLTSSATGNIWVQSNSNSNTAIYGTAPILKTGGGRSTLTLRADGRVNFNGSITASGTAVLDTVLWSDYKDTGSGGVSVLGNVSTNGGNLWAGGSNSSAGSSIWNGLTVGNGPSRGANGYNFNAFDLNSAINTGGGQVMLWAGDGYSSGISGLGLTGTSSITSGSGNITLAAKQIAGTGMLTLNSTGKLTLAPEGGSYGSALAFNGSLAGGTFTSSGWSTALKINNFANLGGLTVGRYTGTGLAGDTVYSTIGNSSSVSIGGALSIAGPLEIYGGDIAINANLTTTGVGAGILAKASGNITSAASRTLRTNNGDLVLWSNSGNSGNGSIQLGDSNTLNTANGAANQSSGGGRITLGGGLDTSTGFATSASNAGITLGTSTSSTTTMQSGGGDILLRGKSTASSGGYSGIDIFSGVQMNAGQGAITMRGESSAGYGVEFSRTGGSPSRIVSAKQTGAAIDITGITTKASEHGLVFDYGTVEEVLATGGGNIALTGSAITSGFYGVW